jgi:hypothetical protein
MRFVAIRPDFLNLTQVHRLDLMHGFCVVFLNLGEMLLILMTLIIDQIESML